MVKLSQQLRAAESALRTRPTRTQRILEKQRQRKLPTDINQKLLQQARDIQQKQFTGLTSLSEYTKRFNSLSPQLQRFFTKPAELEQQIEVQKQADLANIDRLILKREEKINQEKNRANPREERLDRWDAEIDALERGREDINRGASAESVFQFARLKGRVAVEPQVKTAKIFIGRGGRPTVQRKFKEGRLISERVVKLGAPIEKPIIMDPEVEILARKIEPVLKEGEQFLAPESRDVDPFERIPQLLIPQIDLDRTTISLKEVRDLQQSGNITGLQKALFEGEEEAKDVNDASLRINQTVQTFLAPKNFTLRSETLFNRTQVLINQTEEFNKDIELFNLIPSPSRRKELQDKQKELNKERIDIVKEQKELRDIFKEFEKKLKLIGAPLKAKGINIVVDEEAGEIKFLENGKEVDTKSLNIKSQVLLADEPTRRTVLHFSTALVEGEKEFARFLTLGKLGALSEATNILSKINRALRLPPKVGKVSLITGGVVLGGGIVGLEAIAGFQRGREIDKALENTITGALIGVSEIGGAVAGGTVGSRAFRARQQKQFEDALKKSLAVSETTRTSELRKVDKQINALIRQTTKSQKIFAPKAKGAKLKTEALLKEAFVEKQELGFGAGLARTELTTQKGTLKGGGKFFAIRSKATGNVRLKVITPTQVKGKLRFKTETFLIKQSDTKIINQIIRGDLSTKDLKILRNIKLSDTLIGKTTPGSTEAAFGTELLEELGEKAIVFSPKEFAVAKPFAKTASIERVIENLRTKEFVTQAKGLEFSEEAIRSITRNLVKDILETPLLNKRGTVNLLPPEIRGTNILETSGLEDITGSAIKREGVKTINIAQQLAKFRIETLQNEILLKQQKSLGGIVGFSLKDFSKEFNVGKDFQEQVNKLTQNQQKIQQQISQEISKALPKQITQPLQQQLVQQQLQTQLQQQIQQLLQAETTTTTTTIPSIPVEVPGVPGVPPFIFIPGIPKAKRKKKKKKRTLLETEVLAFLPDFTAKALGIEPLVVDVNQAERLVRRELSGLEIRPGARLR